MASIKVQCCNGRHSQVAKISRGKLSLLPRDVLVAIAASVGRVTCYPKELGFWLVELPIPVRVGTPFDVFDYRFLNSLHKWDVNNKWWRRMELWQPKSDLELQLDLSNGGSIRDQERMYEVVATELAPVVEGLHLRLSRSREAAACELRTCSPIWPLCTSIDVSMHSDNWLDSDVFNALAGASSLIKLRIDDVTNYWDDYISINLRRARLSDLVRLKHLRIVHVLLPFSAHLMRDMLCFLERNPSIKHLMVNCEDIESVDLLAKYLETNTVLECLCFHVEEIEIQWKHTKALLKGMSRNRSILTLQILSGSRGLVYDKEMITMIRENNTLTAIDFGYLRMSEVEGIEVAKALSTNNTLKWINFNSSEVRYPEPDSRHPLKKVLRAIENDGIETNVVLTRKDSPICNCLNEDTS